MVAWNLSRVDAPFSADWTAGLRRNVIDHLSDLRQQPVRCLEIGVFEGLGAAWLLDNLLIHPDSQYVGVDSWLHVPLGDPQQAEQRARQVLSTYGDKAELRRGDTLGILPQLQSEGRRFDLIYVDGDHASFSCLTDTVLAWPLLAEGGIMIWDDYGNPDHPGVQKAVDTFHSCIEPATTLFSNWQKGIQRTE